MPFCQARANNDCFGRLRAPEKKLQVACGKRLAFRSESGTKVATQNAADRQNLISRSVSAARIGDHASDDDDNRN
jgi:hypothetical protein